MADHDRTVRSPIGRDPQAEEAEVDTEHEQGCSGEKQNEAKEDAPDSVPQIERPLGHAAPIISLIRTVTLGKRKYSLQRAPHLYQGSI